MTNIPEAMKKELKKSGTTFNRHPLGEEMINQSLMAIAKRAVGNVIEGDEPYTIRINFQNGRIVGSDEKPKLSVELLNGRSSTSVVGVPSENTRVFLELKSLVIEGVGTITNGDSWVARVNLNGDTVDSVFVNRDFSEEDQELIKTVLLRGFGPQIQM